MIPKSGTSTMRDIITRCFDLRMVVVNDLFDHRNKRLGLISVGIKICTLSNDHKRNKDDMVVPAEEFFIN